MKGNIGYMELHTPDLDKSKRFYAELFDWRVEDLKTPGGDYALFHSGGSVDGGMLKDATPMWLSYITVEQLEGAVTRAKALGARVHPIGAPPDHAGMIPSALRIALHAQQAEGEKPLPGK